MVRYIFDIGDFLQRVSYSCSFLFTFGIGVFLHCDISEPPWIWSLGLIKSGLHPIPMWTSRVLGQAVETLLGALGVKVAAAREIQYP